MLNETMNDVKIKLTSSIKPLEGDVETYEMWLHGSFVEKSGTPYLRYEEVQENQTIKTTIKLASNRAVIIRNGAVSMRLPLNTEQQEHGQYKNALGSIPIETKTHMVTFDQLNQSGRFRANYDLLIEGNSVGTYSLEIEYQEV